MKLKTLACVIAFSVLSPFAYSQALKIEAQEAKWVTLYKEAARNLREGRDYERTVKLLTEAAKENPSASLYNALGCAASARACVIGYAASKREIDTQNKDKYKAWKAEWDKAQKERDNPKRGTPPPPLPPVLKTRDDNKPFTLTAEQTPEVFLSWHAQAEAAWKQAEALAVTQKEKAETAYLRGWNLRLFRQYGQFQFEDDKLPTQENVIEAFRQAVKLAPSRAVYWQSLGDACYNEPWYYFKRRINAEEAIAAYTKATALNADNASLWLRLYEAWTENAKTDEDKTKAQQALQTYAETSHNAFGYYFLAEWKMRDTLFGKATMATRNRLAGKAYSEALANNPVDTIVAGFDETEKTKLYNALAEVERGNTAPVSEYPKYNAPLPAFLLPAARCDKESERYYDDITRWMRLIGPLQQSALVYLKLHEEEKSITIANLVLSFGRRYAEAESKAEPERPSLEKLRSMLTWIFNEMGLNTFQKIWHGMGRVEDAARVAEERKTLRSQQDARRLERETNEREIYQTLQ